MSKETTFLEKQNRKKNKKIFSIRFILIIFYGISILNGNRDEKGIDSFLQNGAKFDRNLSRFEIRKRHTSLFCDGCEQARKTKIPKTLLSQSRIMKGKFVAIVKSRSCPNNATALYCVHTFAERFN